MLNIGITGQAGFIGTHLYNTLGLYPDKFHRIPFHDEFFQDPAHLKNFARQCDVIVHLAALNRHNDPREIYSTNIHLVRTLLDACEQAGSKPHILFSSSTQEEKDNPYGKSKLEGRKLFTEWAEKVNAKFTGFVIPNVFGPFGNPYYNSVIATFCHQLTHHETPKIEIDGTLKLIYVGEVVEKIITKINEARRVHPEKKHIETIHLSHTSEAKVSEILSLLESYKSSYFEKGAVPDLANSFHRNLFNTFLCFIDHRTFFPFRLTRHTDHRGAFTEILRVGSGGQVSHSTTGPGITRGNHFHTRKAERFAVIRGKARINLRRIGTNEILSFDLDGEQPSFVDMPVWFTHNITNTGTDELHTVFWINEFFNPADPDTFAEVV
jgi:UDP-2-acetamido-2,6-beta-L-arabino-hexul-4-ose reductase